MAREGYNGNPNLKKTGIQLEWTKLQVSEYMKCEADPIYFAEKYMRIINLDKGLVPFKMYDYQKDIVNSIKDNRNTVAVCSRQSGKSTTTCAFILWYILFNESKTVALLANKGDTAREIMGRVQLAYQHLPKWLQHGVVEWNKGSMILENGSRILATTTTGNSIRGYSVNLLYIDECAFVEGWAEFWASTVPVITSGETTKIVLISTPKGLNYFYTIVENARKKKNDYNLIEVPWQRVPGRNEKWKKKTIGELNYDMEKFAQEFEISFIGSSGTLIAGWKLKELVGQTPIDNKNGNYQYKLPEKDHQYVCLADVSEGKGFDYSAFHIIDVTKMPYEQVFVYRDNTTPYSEYAQTIHRISTLYNNAHILVENNNIGGQVVNSIGMDLEYENLIHTASKGAQGKIITNGWNGGTGELGVRMSTTVKAVGCSMLKLMIEQNQLIINDENTIFELSTFIRKAKTFVADEGKHDDLAMGLVLFAWMTGQTYFKEITDINTLNKLRNRSEVELAEDLMSFGIPSEEIDNNIDDIRELGFAYSDDVDWYFH